MFPLTVLNRDYSTPYVLRTVSIGGNIPRSGSNELRFEGFRVE